MDWFNWLEQAVQSKGGMLFIAGLIVIALGYTCVKLYRDKEALARRIETQNAKTWTLLEKLYDRLVRDCRRRP